MKEALVSSIQVSAYFLWEYSEHSLTLDLWYCAESIAYFLKENGLFSNEKIRSIIATGKDDPGYINFVRYISYFIYEHTHENDSVKNWYIAERLLKNDEWVNSMLEAAALYRSICEGEKDIADSIRSDKIKRRFFL